MSNEIQPDKRSEEGEQRPAIANQSFLRSLRPPKSAEALHYSFPYKGKRYRVVEHPAAKKGVYESYIWKHGLEVKEVDSRGNNIAADAKGRWICSRCWDKVPHTIFYDSSSSTSRAKDHLLEEHRIGALGPLQEMSGSLTEEQARGTTVEEISSTIVTSVTKKRFLGTLVRWIVVCRVALLIVEDVMFRTLVNLLNPALETHMWHSGDSVRMSIMNDFLRSREYVVQRLQRSRSKVHFSFDLWTSSNGLPFVGVVAHWLDEECEAQSVLIALRRIDGRHSGENIAAILLKVAGDFELTNRLGFFMADNAESNDVAIRLLLEKLEPGANSKRRRVRCIGHIFNLVVKAFLFGEDAEAFEQANDNLDQGRLDESQERQLLQAWRKRGPVGKLHNVVLWIRSSPQRRQEFAGIAVGDEDEINSMQSYIMVCARLTVL
jgi:hypothetical protein